MWKFISEGIINKNGYVLAVVLAITMVMAYYSRQAVVAYNFPKILPSDNPIFKEFTSFRQKFGEEANTLIIGVETKNGLDGKTLSAIKDMAVTIKKDSGVKSVLSIADLYKLSKDTINNRMVPQKVFSDSIVRPWIGDRKGLSIDSIHKLELLSSGFEGIKDLPADSIRHTLASLPVYKNLLYHNNTYLILVGIDSKVLDSKARIPLVRHIQALTADFAKKTGTTIYMSGLPLVRTVISTQVAHEISLFTILSFVITGIILLIMLRSIMPVLISMVCVGIAVIWSVAFTVLFHYQISLLTGLLPPLVVVIGITNCVYIYNTYFFEWGRDNDKEAVLKRAIRKIGEATFFTNLTAAIGFGVFALTGSKLLVEFGVVAFLSIISIFVVTITIIPALSVYLPVPRGTSTKQEKQVNLFRFLDFTDKFSQKRQGFIFATTIIVSLIFATGLYYIKATGYIVDDIPKTDKIYTDLKFFEKEFGGVMPIEILVDTKGKGKASPTRTNFYEKVSRLQDSLGKEKDLSRSVSFADALKFINQEFYDGDTSEYKIPGDFDKNIILPYVANMTKNKEGKEGKKGKKGASNMLNNLVDSTKQVARISANMADVGSKGVTGLLAKIDGYSKKVFDTSKYKVIITGTSVVNLEGNRYLINGLVDSLLLAFLLIAICIAYLFRSIKMIFISMLPNLIPLLITAGIMGWSGIPIKPSTVLIFSVAFGIAIDNAIRFLACYKQYLDAGATKDLAVSNAQQEAGLSIVYTTIILFFGFIIFTFSNFGGTFYLGLLTSITLLVALFNNMLVLPAMLRRFA